MELQDSREDRQIHLLELLHTLVKRKKLIIKLCSFAIVASIAYSLTLPNIYSATAKVLPPQKESGGGLSALLGQAGGLAGLATGGLSGGSDLYLGILKSRSVSDAVIQKPDLAAAYSGKTLDDARELLNLAVKIQGGKDGIISITAFDKDPRRAALLANAFVEELSKTTVRLNLTKAGTERTFLEKRLDLVKKDLKTAEESLKQYAQQHQIVQVDSQARASIESIARLKAELASKEVQLAVLRTKQTEESPQVKAMHTTIGGLKRELGSLAGSNSGGEGIPALGDVPGVGLEYSRKMREFKTQEAIFEQLTKQYEMAKLNEAKDSSTLQVLDEAVVPKKKAKPSRARIVIMATLSAFFASIFICFLQEYWEKLPEDEKATMRTIRKQALSFR